MKKLLRQAMTLGLSSTMALGLLAGCNGSGSTPVTSKAASQESTVAGTQTTETGTAATKTGGEATAFEKKVSLRIPVYDRGVEGVPDVKNNYWTQWVQKEFGDKYNVEVTYVPITRSDVMTNYSMLASSGDLPTILMEYDYPKVSQWANDGYLSTFDMEAFKQVAPNYYKAMEENGLLDYTKINGETYFAAAVRQFSQTSYSFQTFVRMDWLEKIGYDHVPATYGEKLDAYKKIKEAGLCDYPAGGVMVNGLGSDQNDNYRKFPFDELEWAMYGDFSIPALGYYANKALLKEQNELYALGYTNPEYYLTDNETAKANFISGKSYSFGGYISPKMDWLSAFYAQNPNAKLGIQPLAPEDKERGNSGAYRADNPFGMIIGFSKDSTEDQKKAAWMYMEWMLSDDVLNTMQWGIEGETYTMGKDGLPLAVTDYSGDKKMGYNNNKDYWCIAFEGKNIGTDEQIIKSNCPQGLPQDFSQDIIAFQKDMKARAEKGLAVVPCIFSQVIEAEAEHQSTLVEKYKVFRDELTKCKPEEFDAKYEKLSKEYADAGFAEITNERKAAFEAGMSTKLPK